MQEVEIFIKQVQQVQFLNVFQFYVAIGRNAKKTEKEQTQVEEKTERDERGITDNKDTQKEKQEGQDRDEEKTHKNIRDKNFVVHTCLSPTQK